MLPHQLRIGHEGLVEVRDDVSSAFPDAHDFRVAIDALEEHPLDRLIRLAHGVGEFDDHAVRVADILRGLRLQFRQPLLSDRNHILDHPRDLPAHDFVCEARRVEGGIEPPHLRHQPSKERDFLQHLEGQVA